MEGKELVYTTEDYTKKIKEASKHLMQEYLYIGFLLNEMNDLKVYKEKYKSLVEYAEIELGFKKSTVYNCISVLKRFAVNDGSGHYKMFLKDEYENYNFTQLVQLTKFDDETIEQLEIAPTDSTRDIKEKINSTRVEKKKEQPIEVEYKIETEEEEYEDVPLEIPAEKVEKEIQFVEVETVREIIINPQNYFILSELEIQVLQQFVDKNVELNKIRMDKVGIDRGVYLNLIERLVNYGKDR